MRTWSKTNNLSGWAWRQASKQASRQPRAYRNCNKTKHVRMRENFRGKPRRLKLEQIHMNVYIFKQVHLHWKGRCNFTLYMGQCSFLLTVLAFGCPLSVYSQIDSGCGIKIIVFVSAKNTLSRYQPTNPDPGTVSTTSVQNKQPPAPNASNQNNQSTQTGVKKFSSPKRTPTRHSAAKDFSVWRQACFIMAPKTGSKKLVETWRP